MGVSLLILSFTFGYILKPEGFFLSLESSKHVCNISFISSISIKLANNQKTSLDNFVPLKILVVIDMFENAIFLEQRYF